MSNRATRLTGLYAVLAASAAVLLSPLLALSYFATAEGAEELEMGTVSAWADPARDIVGGLVTWAAPERVYATYVQVFAVLFPAILLCARAVRARRPAAAGRLERWGWRTALFGYALLSVGLIAASVVLVDASAAVKGSSTYAALDVVFISLMLPGMAISVIGSTVLGIGLLRNRFEPRVSAGLLVLAFPSMLVLSTLLGHNSLALLPLFVAWAVTGLRLWREGPTGAARGKIVEIELVADPARPRQLDVVVDE
jgi:hypothetical protein